MVDAETSYDCVFWGSVVSFWPVPCLFPGDGGLRVANRLQNGHVLGALRGSHVLHGCDVLVLVCHRCKFLSFAGLALAS